MKKKDANTSRVRLPPQARRDAEARRTLDDISSFEKSHHHLCEIENMTKPELIALAEREGFGVPGDVIFDAATNERKRVKLKKHHYLEYCRQKLFSLDSTPVVQRGQKLNAKTYCIVSIYKSLQNAIRITAYDTERSMEYYMFLSSSVLEDLDIPKLPIVDGLIDDDYVDNNNTNAVQLTPMSVGNEVESVEEIARRKVALARRKEVRRKEWEYWSGPFIERLCLTPQGDLYVGPAKLMANGLSKNFCLTGRDAVSIEEAKKKEPSRKHIANFFRDM
jgi:hypothetical protein